MVSSNLNASPSGPRVKSSVQPTRSNASVPLGASTTPSTEMYSVTTILPMVLSFRVALRSLCTYDRRRGARSSVGAPGAPAFLDELVELAVGRTEVDVAVAVV